MVTMQYLYMHGPICFSQEFIHTIFCLPAETLEVQNK